LWFDYHRFFFSNYVFEFLINYDKLFFNFKVFLKKFGRLMRIKKLFIF